MECKNLHSLLIMKATLNIVFIVGYFAIPLLVGLILKKLCVKTIYIGFFSGAALGLYSTYLISFFFTYSLVIDIISFIHFLLGSFLLSILLFISCFFIGKQQLSISLITLIGNISSIFCYSLICGLLFIIIVRFRRS